MYMDNMNKNNNLTQRDPHEIGRREHEEILDAKRVMVVGGDFGIAAAVKDGLKGLKFDMSASNPQVVEKPYVVKEVEYREIEKPVIVTQIEYREIEKQVIVKEIEYREVEKPVIVKEVEYREIDKYEPSSIIKFIIMSQILIIIGLMVKMFIK